MTEKYIVTNESFNGIYHIARGGLAIPCAKDRRVALKISDILNREGVEPCHVKDVIHDLLYSWFIAV